MAANPAPTSPAVAGAAPARGQRIMGLDSLRGLAALSVLVGHYTAHYHRLYGHDARLAFQYPYAVVGVLLFFMISGFVILMTAERAAGAMDFAWARFSRLYPAYWVAVAVTFTVLAVFPLPGRHASFGAAVANLAMFHNLLGVPSVDGVYWTLQVELCFYAMVFGLLVCGGVRYVELLLIGLVSLAAADELLLGGVKGEWLVRLRHLLLLEYAYAFLIGVTLYRSLNAPRWWHWPAVAGCLLWALCFAPRPHFYAAAGFTPLLYLTTRGHLALLGARWLVLLGTLSYPLYLTHQNIGYVVIRAGYRFGLNPNVSVALAAVVALGIAAVITFTVERPAMALLRQRRPRWLGGRHLSVRAPQLPLPTPVAAAG
jgi:peptidoglycan/LPS O-acetylase OafA/YrhL